MSNMQLVSKLTLSKIGAQPKVNSISQKTDLATLYGRVKGKKIEQGIYGDFVRFNGEFEGVNLQTGEVYRSAHLLVPKILESLLSEALNQNDAVIDFAIEIGAVPSDKGNTGYEYTVKPLIEPAASDELAALRNVIQKALPNPKESV